MQYLKGNILKFGLMIKLEVKIKNIKLNWKSTIR